VRLDHHRHRNFATEAAPRDLEQQRVDERAHVVGRFGLRQRDEREAVARFADQDLELGVPRRVAQRVHARAHPIVAVRLACDQRGDHLRVLVLASDRRAVLAIAGDVEYRAALGLQRERLREVALAARVVHARRERRQGARVAVQRGLRSEAGGHGAR
jgi:hypothetical protein